MVSDIALGTRVRITRKCRKYLRFDLIGKVGIIRSNYGANLAIEFDDVKNPKSGYGYFYFNKSLITPVEDNMEENNMAINTTNITGYTQAIRVKFIDDSSPCSCVYASFEPELKVGDLVVVKPAHHKIALARVHEILEGTDYETTREVVSKVYTDDYNERVKVRTQVAELMAKMQERARQLQDIALYQMLAKDDPAMQALLNEYQALKK
jgi:hypothetical protein